MNDYLIRKKPFYALLIFSLPMIVGNIFQQAYTMVDSAIVGRYVSENALAAVGASYALTNIFIWVAVGGGGYRGRDDLRGYLFWYQTKSNESNCLAKKV